MQVMLASIPEAQRALGIGRSTAYRLIEDGKLETVKIGRRRLVRVDSIRALALGRELVEAALESVPPSGSE